MEWYISRTPTSFTCSTPSRMEGGIVIFPQRRSLLEIKPQIVHFCGHGSGEGGLVLEDDGGNEQFVANDELSRLFEVFVDRVECILLNACYSEVQADALIQHINYVIGMNREIPEAAAIAFSIGFYDAIGAGETVENAYKLGCSAIETDLPHTPTSSRKLIPIQSPEAEHPTVLPDYLIPVLKKKQNINEIVPVSPFVSVNNSEIEPFIGHSDWIRSLAFSPDSKTLLSGSNDRTLRLWNLETGRLLYLLTGH